MTTPSLLDYTRLGLATAAQPIVVLWRLASSPFNSYEKKKPWRRVIYDASFRWVVYTQRMDFLGYMMGPSVTTYEKYMKKHLLEPRIQDVDDAKLLWVGERDPERVILYLHGGGFLLPLGDYSLAFWRYVQKELTRTGCEGVAIAVLDYTLVADAGYPTQLRQSIAAVKQLLADGIKPENIILTGDSAGGNLVTQLLLHQLHPVEGLQELSTDMKFGGAYMMSPWTDLLPRGGVASYKKNAKWDFVAAPKLAYFGRAYLDRVREEKDLKYIDAHYAPGRWYDGVGNIVDKVLITAGGAESLRDDIVRFADRFGKAHGDTKVVVDKFGVHNDPFLDFYAGETKQLSELTPIILEWIKEVFEIA
ncbi:hypothetical protein NLJ89_g6940 [Agrocybe chaxingu]|uniref:Alpha/beta hydrolase fold-3 domain-containing protein n=1 Tax=Agrocybe chaxingu TaxID=84603 RepID=A0A9W8MS75_9AGAR|nr:hypothetical protein NLJ89_g6940 [Agrocybe chaxingu]